MATPVPPPVVPQPPVAVVAPTPPQTPQPPSNQGRIMAIIFGLVILTTIIAIVVSIYRRKPKKTPDSSPPAPGPAPGPSTCTPDGSSFAAAPSGFDCCSGNGIDGDGNCLPAATPGPSTTSSYVPEPYVKE